jgi:hypothetical protein
MKCKCYQLFFIAAIGVMINSGCSIQTKLTKEEAISQLADLKMKSDIASPSGTISIHRD